ncbi:hypothetical protein JW758_02610 [Candidatus Peregrinibacteria bacterium]|nr:hypothetical protein [Candidatus Peregrinibacteria bacterium]
MKKIFATILIIIIFIAPLTVVQANDEVGFLDGSTNIYKLNSYKIIQTISGNMKVDDYGDIMDMNYKFFISGNANNKKYFESDSYSRINGTIMINLIESEKSLSSIPFSQLTINLSGEVTSIFNDGLYLRLSELDVIAKDIGESELNGMNDFLKGISDFKGKWYKIPASDLSELNQASLESEYGSAIDTELFQPETVIEYFKENDIKTGFGEYIKDVMGLMNEYGGVDNEEYEIMTYFIDRLVETEFFNIRDVVSGRNTGFKFFTFNKSSIINIIKDIAEKMNIEIGYAELNELRSGLNKFSIAGLYRVNKENDILDNLFIKFTLRNIENLINFNMNYRYKIVSFDAPKVSAPKEYVDFMDIMDIQDLMMY